MINKDTIRLLKECDAGIKMGITSIDDVINYVDSDLLRSKLVGSKNEHEKLKNDLQELLDEYHDDGKKPNPFLTTMSWLKTTTKLIINESDHTIADLMTQGCNMGIKSLSKYLNEYQEADERSKDLVKKLIKVEDKLLKDVRPFL